MIHVPDVSAAADWYVSVIRFKVVDLGQIDGEAVWAMLSFGESRLMLNAGGRPSAEHRREIDLYLYVDDVDDVFERIKDGVEVVEGLHDTFYGMREFTIRDLNRFWITFGQPVQESRESTAAGIRRRTRWRRSRRS